MFTIKLSPANTDTFVKTINFNDWDAIVVADISTKDRDFLNNEKVILVDHHATAVELHDPSNNLFVYEHNCGTYLLNKLIECVKQKQDKKMNELVDIINDYDMWVLKDERSKPLQALFYHIGEDKFTERFWNFKVKFNDEENKWWNDTVAHRNKIFDEMEIFQDEGSNVGFIFQEEFSNEFCEMALNQFNIDVVVFIKPGMGSVRTKRRDINIGHMLENLGIGGGHAQAGGFRCKGMSEVQDCVKRIEDYLKQK